MTDEEDSERAIDGDGMDGTDRSGRLGWCSIGWRVSAGYGPDAVGAVDPFHILSRGPR